MEKLGSIASKYFPQFTYVLKSVFSKHGNSKFIRRNMAYTMKKVSPISLKN